MRLELPDGQWAELRERLTHGQATRIRAASIRAKADPGAGADLPTAFMEAFVSSWHVLDFDGHAVSLETPENAPDEIMVDICAAAVDIWNRIGQGTVPKAGNGSLPTPLSGSLLTPLETTT